MNAIPPSGMMPRRSYLPIKLFYVFLIAFFGIVIYQMVNSFQKDKKESPKIIDKPKNARQPLTVSKDRIKRPEVGNDMSFSFWIYINDWSYLLGKTKHVFHVGDQAMTKVCPGLWLYPTDTNLMVRIDTYENVNEVNYNSRKGFDFVENKRCPLGDSTEMKGCRKLCSDLEECSGYTEYETTADTKCRYWRMNVNPNNTDILKADNTATAFAKLKTKNPLFYNDTSNFNITKQCDVAEIKLQTWTHLAVVISENNLRVYINGVLARNCELSSMPKMNDGDLYINMDGGFDGLISDFRYHPSAISEEQVKQLYKVAHVFDPKSFADFNPADFLPSCRLGEAKSPNALPQSESTPQ